MANTSSMEHKHSYLPLHHYNIIIILLLSYKHNSFLCLYYVIILNTHLSLFSSYSLIARAESQHSNAESDVSKICFLRYNRQQEYHFEVLPRPISNHNIMIREKRAPPPFRLQIMAHAHCTTMTFEWSMLLFFFILCCYTQSPASC